MCSLSLTTCTVLLWSSSSHSSHTIVQSISSRKPTSQSKIHSGAREISLLVFWASIISQSPIFNKSNTKEAGTPNGAPASFFCRKMSCSVIFLRKHYYNDNVKQIKFCIYCKENRTKKVTELRKERQKKQGITKILRLF